MGALLKELTYEQVAPMITEDSVIVLPIGGGAKEHGNHLPMGTDYYITDWIAEQVAERCNVIMLPTLSFGYFPAFVKWKGSVSIKHDHFSNYVKDIILSFTCFGVKKFLIIDGGVSTHAPLVLMAKELYNEFHVMVGVTNMLQVGADVEEEICEQKDGGHGDEAETSMMLYIREDLVHMDRAAEEYCNDFPDTKINGRTIVTMPSMMDTISGINGNSFLATKEKGEKLLFAIVEEICGFLKTFTSYKVEREE